MSGVKYQINGRDVSEEEFRAHGESRLEEALESRQAACGQSPAGWPATSEAVGVHPAQREEAYRESVRLGVPTQYDSLGRAVLTDPGHRKKLLKALGYVDRGKKLITMPKGRNHNARV